MHFTRLVLENWRNFKSVDVPLRRRMFIVGPNASGKSNLLDAFRFLRDIADPQGGLARAVQQPSRRGVSQLRSLFARKYPNVAVEVHAVLDEGADAWSYRLEFGQDNQQRPVVKREVVRFGTAVLLNRPDADDVADPSRLSQTHLEQVNANRGFRAVAEALAQVRYLHLVPQLVREPELVAHRLRDPLGSDFLEQMASINSKTRRARLTRICRALRVAVPQLVELDVGRDARGVPHLAGRYEHWRPNGAKQSEEQFSDGTLRLLGLLWAFLDGKSPLLLEEPELSLHPGVVRQIPLMLARVSRPAGRQVLLSTHSKDLLQDRGIDATEVLMLVPDKEGTQVIVGAADQQVRALLEGGLPVAEAVLPRTTPKAADELVLSWD
jgi:predicted ATPase